MGEISRFQKNENGGDVMLSKQHDRFLFWLEGCKSSTADAIRKDWQDGKPYTGKVDVNLRNKTKEFIKLNDFLKGKKK